MNKVKTLLVYYHPVVLDLVQTFRKLGHHVTLAVNPTIKDNYGTGMDVIQRAKERFGIFVDVLPLQIAAKKIQDFDLVGCDGVFDGDKIIMEVADKHNIPRFCIQGYPNVMDEPSDNILSFGWFTPTVQYHQKYPSEGHKKLRDWKNIAENTPEGKNICVFYPNFWDFKARIGQNPDLSWRNSSYISLIQGYEKWNKWSFETFKKLQKDVPVENLEGVPHVEVFKRLRDSRGLIHLKWADQPGIALIEAMLLARPVLTMRSFVVASMNQEVLIDGHTAIVADSLDELIYWTKQEGFMKAIGENARKHALMLTNFTRQRMKLERFIERCANV